jgi:hypothetical protein
MIIRHQALNRTAIVFSMKLAEFSNTPFWSLGHNISARLMVVLKPYPPLFGHQKNHKTQNILYTDPWIFWDLNLHPYLHGRLTRFTHVLKWSLTHANSGCVLTAFLDHLTYVSFAFLARALTHSSLEPNKSCCLPIHGLDSYASALNGVGSCAVMQLSLGRHHSAPLAFGIWLQVLRRLIGPRCKKLGPISKNRAHPVSSEPRWSCASFSQVEYIPLSAAFDSSHRYILL